jgi:hypothetical protein
MRALLHITPTPRNIPGWASKTFFSSAFSMVLEKIHIFYKNFTWENSKICSIYLKIRKEFQKKNELKLESILSLIPS